MSYFNSINSRNSAAPVSSYDSAHRNDRPNNDIDIDRKGLMQIMLANMRNVDIPLAGDKGNSSNDFGTKFVDNMVSFSDIGAKQNLNDIMISLADTIKQNTLFQRAAMMQGQNVRVENDILVKNGKVSDSFFDLPSGVSQATISVSDKHDNVVYNRVLSDLDEGINKFSWLGFGNDDKPVADGKYKISVDAYDKKGMLIDPARISGLLEGKISRVDFSSLNNGDGESMFILDNGMKFLESQLHFI
ncbi:hypothetical protein GUI12_00015 [Anaplasmataceae bacterium AB001_6]|nr:hypothetical protein GUI12_00015 [Anaplasmataceae bacterium AB001_6]